MVPDINGSRIDCDKLENIIWSVKVIPNVGLRIMRNLASSRIFDQIKIMEENFAEKSQLKSPSQYIIQKDTTNNSIKVLSPSQMDCKRISMKIQEQVDKEKKLLSSQTVTVDVVGETKVIIKPGGQTVGSLIAGEYDRLLIAGIPSVWNESYIGEIFSTLDKKTNNKIPFFENIEVSYDVGSQSSKGKFFFFFFFPFINFFFSISCCYIS